MVCFVVICYPSLNWVVYYFTNTKFEAAFNRIAHLNICFGKCRKRTENQDVSKTGENVSFVSNTINTAYGIQQVEKTTYMMNNVLAIPLE
jgi:hypothetical protein